MIESGTDSLGKPVFRINEPDAPDLIAVVSFPDGGSNPEADLMMFSVMRDDESVGSQKALLMGRAGLLGWYVEEVGYSPDEDIGQPTPIEELIDSVGSHLLLRGCGAWT